jgi:acetylornithine deacetylase
LHAEGHFQRFDECVADHADDAFTFLERLVAAPSTVGHEQLAQDLVAGELASLGFEVTCPPVPEQLVRDPLAGVGQTGYAGRYNVLGRLNGPEPGLLINGHIDVVPASPAGWRSDPFRPVRSEGWLVGRGAGDMKGGFAMALLALRALADSMPEALERPLAFLSVIEEECTGNGTLASVLDGLGGRAVILPEPSDLGLLLSGVGVLWVDIEICGAGGHAHAADRLATPVDAVLQLAKALNELGGDLARDYPDPQLAGVAQPYTVNVGRVQCGDWRSSVASAGRLGVRVGFPRGWSADDAMALVTGFVDKAMVSFGGDLTVTTEPTGFRAEGYALSPDHELVRLVSACHEDAHGSPPRAFGLGSTTDARYYVNQVGTPALCYGPVARDIHGANEAVLLESIVGGARTLGRVIATFDERTEFSSGEAVSCFSKALTGTAGDQQP